jgi:predicted metalloprotease with PDZ domain
LRTNRPVPRYKSRCFLVALALFASVAAAAQALPPPPLELRYHLRLPRPSTHLAEIEIEARQVTEPRLDFEMPAWSPGRYAIYDFAKNVQEFEALGADGRGLPWTQTDKQTWRIDARDAGGAARVRYKVFGNDLSGSFSQIDSTHANLNGASVYMYVAGHQRDPVTLTVEAPPDWQVISGWSLSTAQRTFQAPNYDRLIDTPMEISPECAVGQFSARGKTFRVAVHDYGGEDGEPSGRANGTQAGPGEAAQAPNPEHRSPAFARLLEGVRKIVSSEMAAMPDPDFAHYTFLFHFAPDLGNGGDGMEHFNSTQIIVPGSLDQAALPEALEDAAHEFFHVWNVKRLRPAALGPFDYTRENYTPSLWFAEGLTTYYAYVSLLRSGVWERKEFLKRLAEEVRNLELEPGRALMSAESSSFHAWFYDRSPQMQETNFSNSTISYYNKGALLGMLLDLEIRARTRGQKSLDNVLRLMYQEFYGASAGSYYAQGRGYEESDVLKAVNEVAGSDFGPFFERYVRGTEPLPYSETLALAGLRLRVAAEAGAPPSLGISVQTLDRGAKITSVKPGGAADRAGLARDDLLIAVDELSLATEELRNRLKIYPAGAEVPFTVERHGRRTRINVKLDPPVADRYSIEEIAEATPEQVSVRDGWLAPSPLPPPQRNDDRNQRTEYDDCQNRQVGLFEQADQPLPVASEQEPDAADGGGPNHGAREVEEQETRVGHQEGAREGSGENAQAGDEATEKHRPPAVFQHEGLSAVVVMGGHEEAAAQSSEQRRPPEISHGVAQAVADGGPGNGGENGGDEVDLSVEGQEPRKKQDGLAGHGQAGVLQHDAEEDHPVAVVSKPVGVVSK